MFELGADDPPENIALPLVSLPDESTCRNAGDSEVELKEALLL